MLFTLMEIAERHPFPFIVRHRYNTYRWLVLKQSEMSEVIFEVRRLHENEDTPRVGESAEQIYGGYGVWQFEKEVEKKTGISPEEQKRLREEQRKIDNEKTKRAYRLKAGDSVRSRSTTRPKEAKQAVKEKAGTVISVDFTRKKL